MGLGNPQLGLKVQEQFPNNHIAVGLDNWFVVEEAATAFSVAVKLGMVPTAENIIGIVVTVGGYFGLAPNNIWEWLKAKGSQTPVG